MGNSLVSILVLAGIAIFLILRLRSVLGTREGFEKPRVDLPEAADAPMRRDFEVIEGGVDHDIVDNVDAGSRTADTLAEIKQVDPTFTVSEFLSGARGAYEMILMAFEHNDLESIKPFISEDVHDAFAEGIASREAAGLTIESQFVGLREIKIVDANMDSMSKEAEIKVRFVGETTSVVRNATGEIVEGNPNEIKRQKDVWTFERDVDSNDPNWQLVATGA